jgi:hypothetical protein
MKLLIMQFSPFHSYVVCLRPKYPPKHHIVEHPHPLCSSLTVRDQFSTNIIMVICILVLILLDINAENKRLCTEWQQAFPEFILLVMSS